MSKYIKRCLDFVKKDKVLSTLLGLLLLSGILYFFVNGRYLKISGDEDYYFTTSRLFVKLFGHLFALEFEKIPHIWSTIINRGWFIPSMSLLVTPIRFFTDRVDLIRLFLFVLNYLGTIYILVKSRDIFGKNLARILAVCMLLMPMYTIYSFTLWGGAIAGRMLLILFFVLAGLELKGAELSVKKAVRIGLLLACIIYFRSSLILVAPCVICYLFFLELQKEKPFKVFLSTFVKQSSSITLVVLSLLLPWSFSVTKKFNIPTLTVTSANMSYIICCGSNKLKNDIKKAHSSNNVYRDMYVYYGKKAKGNVKKLYKKMNKDNIKARKSISQRRALNLVRRVFSDLFFFERGGFMGRFTKGKQSKASTFVNAYANYAIYAYGKFWRLLLLANMLLLFLIFSGKSSLHIGLLFKLCLFCAILPHFLIFAGNSRHSIVLIPMLLFGFAYLLSGKFFSKTFFKYNLKSLQSWSIALLQVAILGFALFLLSL